MRFRAKDPNGGTEVIIAVKIFIACFLGLQFLPGNLEGFYFNWKRVSSKKEPSFMIF